MFEVGTKEIADSMMEAYISGKSDGYIATDRAYVENECAIHMYESIGFTEFGRNPMGFISR